MGGASAFSGLYMKIKRDIRFEVWLQHDLNKGRCMYISSDMETFSERRQHTMSKLSGVDYDQTTY
jgi:hypothetical protein